MKLKKYQHVALAIIAITIGVIGFFVIQHIVYGKVDNIAIHWSILFTVVVSANITLVSFPFFQKIKVEFPLKRDILRSLVKYFFITSGFAATIISFWVLVFYFSFGEFLDQKFEGDNLGVVLFDNIVTALLVNFIVGAIWTLRIIALGWKKASIEAEKFKRLSAESKYSALLSQINPHFLFNSMNVLASLIPESPEKSVEFVGKFSKIYRYVLEVKDKIVSEMAEELDFLESYCYLQKIRYGDNLIIEKNINTQCLDDFLPPLSLQLLVENAIKHNEVSKANPLKISIESNGQFMIVKNSLRMKFSKEDSAGIGLNNLKERYSHLTEMKPEFYIKNNEYIAKIPLIKEE